ncbi:hypothetical protein K437DRAFT_170756 [Tilletiaria anomala UBC 951]|uniref:Zn(2)-C6 fungal-type domain-containing protein n=1 Tax=Tilletiaria anomala (strain ATCC 24038 / CBS 436.72 / UBC 951) TaxID=1037660 RepID=A0A066VJ86_TILAU|nr:uncharacterized protein K437DRAFT_170756 [Tilletiaria anomala UBC 951]KDN41792.1 hypothetical protein K437DRAFT_170756 [Tilletiaria anomala UBC 951]
MYGQAHHRPDTAGSVSSLPRNQQQSASAGASTAPPPPPAAGWTGPDASQRHPHLHHNPHLHQNPHGSEPYYPAIPPAPAPAPHGIMQAGIAVPVSTQHPYGGTASASAATPSKDSFSDELQVVMQLGGEAASPQTAAHGAPSRKRKSGGDSGGSTKEGGGREAGRGPRASGANSAAQTANGNVAATAALTAGTVGIDSENEGSPNTHLGGSGNKQSRPGKVRKVVVTSCDACRARKLRCNAKELPLGEACSNCVKSKAACSFDYCADTTGGTIRLRNRVAELDAGAAIVATGGLAQLASLAGTGGHASTGGGGVGGGGGAGSRGVGEFRNGPTWHSGFGADVEAFRYANEDPSSWSIPLVITAPQTGMQATYALQGVVDTLLARFFEQGTLATMIMFKDDVMSRYTAQQQAAATAATGMLPPAEQQHPEGPLPAFLILAMLACAAVSSVTSEPELIEWGKTVGWHLALRGVQRRLATEGVPDLDLLQAIVLVSACWCGDNPNSQERIALFETAFRLAYDMNLTSSLDTNRLALDIKAKRIVIFWVLYALDKAMAIITRRPVQLDSELHSIPRLSLTDVVRARAKGTPRALAPDPRANNEDVWTCRLLEAFVSLCAVFEKTRLPMIERRAMQSLTFRAMQNQISSVEGELEDWCQNHGELLSTATCEGQVFQGIAEGLVVILHVAQLQLYSPTLRYESRQASKVPMKFSDSNSKALTACIESSWHLIQQPESRFALAGGSADRPSMGTLASTITTLGVVRATQFLRFLSTTWADWRQGYGMHDCLPRASVDTQQNLVAAAAAADGQHVDPALQAQQEKEEQQPTSQQRVTSTDKGTGASGRSNRATNTPHSEPWGAPPPAPSTTAGGRRGRKQVPAPLDFASPQNSTSSSSDTSAATDQQAKDGANVKFTHMQPTPTTPARFLFEMPRTASLNGWMGSMPGAMGAMMTPLRPDFLGGLDLNIPWE